NRTSFRMTAPASRSLANGGWRKVDDRVIRRLADRVGTRVSASRNVAPRCGSLQYLYSLYAKSCGEKDKVLGDRADRFGRGPFSLARSLVLRYVASSLRDRPRAGTRSLTARLDPRVHS